MTYFLSVLLCASQRPYLPVDYTTLGPELWFFFFPPSHSLCRSWHRPVRRPKPIFTLPTLIQCCAHILTPAVLDRHHLCSVGRSRSSPCHHFFKHVSLNNLRAGGWETFLRASSRLVGSSRRWTFFFKNKLRVSLLYCSIL